MRVFEECGWETLPHPAYSAVMIPLDYDTFRKLKELLRRIRFPDLEELNVAESQCIH